MSDDNLRWGGGGKQFFPFLPGPHRERPRSWVYLLLSGHTEKAENNFIMNRLKSENRSKSINFLIKLMSFS